MNLLERAFVPDRNVVNMVIQQLVGSPQVECDPISPSL